MRVKMCYLIGLIYFKVVVFNLYLKI